MSAPHLLRVAAALVVRDWRVRFRRTVLGMAWLCVPMVGLAALAVSLGLAAPGPAPGSASVPVPVPVPASQVLAYLLAGLALWQLFTDAWFEPMRLSRRAGPLLRAFCFDAQALLLAGALSALAALAVRLPLVLAALAWAGLAPGPGAWVLLPGLLLIVAAGSALACFTLPAGLVLHDLRHGLPLAQWGLLVATPVLYAPPGQGLLAQVAALNPLTVLVPGLRDLALGPSALSGLSDLPAQAAHAAHAAPSWPATPGAWLAAVAAVVLPLLGLGLAYYGPRLRLAVAYVGH